MDPITLIVTALVQGAAKSLRKNRLHRRVSPPRRELIGMIYAL
jgi:hypothetical protein